MAPSSDTESTGTPFSSPASTPPSSPISPRSPVAAVHVPAQQPRRGEVRLLCPLAIKFSQPRVRPTFQDGGDVDDASAAVTSVPFTENDEYDEFLAHPFPTIEVIRWRAKARTADGKEIQDLSTGKDQMGEEQWFSLDNRRLHALQKAAVRMWPRRCCVVVRVLLGDFGTALKKFKTLTNGRTVEIGHRFWGKESNSNTTWAWEAAVECLPGPVDAASERAALIAIRRDEARPNDRALAPAAGCAKHLLELLPTAHKDDHRTTPTNTPQQTGRIDGLLNVVAACDYSNFKLPPAATKKKPAAAVAVSRDSKPHATATAKEQMRQAFLRSGFQEKSTANSTPAQSPKPSMTEEKVVDAPKRESKVGSTSSPPAAAKVLDLLQLMKKKKEVIGESSGEAGADSDTTASSGCGSPGRRNNKPAAPARATTAEDAQRKEKRRQRGRKGGLPGERQGQPAVVAA